MLCVKQIDNSDCITDAIKNFGTFLLRHPIEKQCIDGYIHRVQDGFCYSQVFVPTIRFHMEHKSAHKLFPISNHFQVFLSRMKK